MKIIKKEHARTFLMTLDQYGSYDHEAGKWYFVFHDKFRNGTMTIMDYGNGQFSIHGYGENYCDPGEMTLTEQEGIKKIWTHRAMINQKLKEVTSS